MLKTPYAGLVVAICVAVSGATLLFAQEIALTVDPAILVADNEGEHTESPEEESVPLEESLEVSFESEDISPDEFPEVLDVDETTPFEEGDDKNVVPDEQEGYSTEEVWFSTTDGDIPYDSCPDTPIAQIQEATPFLSEMQASGTVPTESECVITATSSRDSVESYEENFEDTQIPPIEDPAEEIVGNDPILPPRHVCIRGGFSSPGQSIGECLQSLSN